MYYPEEAYDSVELIDGELCEKNHAERKGFYCVAHEAWAIGMAKAFELPNGDYVHLDFFDNQAALDEYLASREMSLDVPSPFQIREAA